MDLDALTRFIVAAKRVTYIGNGERATPSRAGAHDLVYEEGGWAYRDSYFGGTDFLGQEVVWLNEEPVWAMNYYGRILRDDLLTAPQAGQMIKASLSQMYRQGRFLGGFEHTENDLTYIDASEGSAEFFHGRELIRREQEVVYELLYHGGLIRN